MRYFSFRGIILFFLSIASITNLWITDAVADTVINSSNSSNNKTDNNSNNNTATPVATTTSTSSATSSLFAQPSQQSTQAFQAMSNASMPMTPDQILQLHKMLDLVQKAAATSPNTPPVPVVTTRFVTLQPGALPPVIRIAQGFVSSLVFLDNTGQPWPIMQYDIGDVSAFSVQSPTKGSNLLLIQAMKPYNYGNIAVTLQGLSTPVMLTLVPGQQVIDYRVDLHISASGPNAKESVSDSQTILPSGTNEQLIDILSGVAPKNAKVLKTSDHGSQAWLVGKTLYLRTHSTVISPAWIGMMNSADGTYAYQLPIASNILVSVNGQLTNLKIEGF